MKKLILSLGFVAASVVAFAQLPTFGIRGGVNFAKMTISSGSPNISVNTGSLTTYSVGVFADFKFGNVSLQPAVNYTGKGGILSSNGDVNTSNLHYIQVPVNLVYHVPVLIGNVYFGAGPYVAVGTSATSSEHDSFGSTNEKVTFGGTNGDLQSTEIGLNGIAGFQFKNGFLVHINYDLGLTNIVNDSNPNNTADDKIKTSTVGLSVGFAF